MSDPAQPPLTVHGHSEMFKALSDETKNKLRTNSKRVQDLMADPLSREALVDKLESMSDFYRATFHLKEEEDEDEEG